MIFILKNSYKGVPARSKLELEAFENALLRRETSKVRMDSLTMDRDRRMTRIQFEKVALSDVSMKLYVHEDHITCSPFKLNNEYI